MNKLDHLGTNNINNKDQYNGAIEYEPKIDNKFSLSGRTKEAVTVLTVVLQGFIKHGEAIISGLTFLRDGGAN